MWCDLVQGSPKPSATHPSSSSQLQGLADGSVDSEQFQFELLSSSSKELSQVASYALLCPDNELNQVWLDLFGHDFFGKSSAAHPSWSSQLQGPAYGWTGGEQPPTSIPDVRSTPELRVESERSRVSCFILSVVPY